jgi:hypothetical protein
MIVKLNTLEEVPSLLEAKNYKCSLDSSIKDMLEHSENCKLNMVRDLVDSGDIEANQEGFLYYLARAYSLHQKIILAPHDFWYIILSEISKIILANPDKCRSAFTSSSEKVEIVIHSGDISIDPLELLKVLKSYVPSNTDIFFPAFSTSTESYNIAAAATFAGGLKLYYNYSTYCCGIPEIKLTGTIADWKAIGNNLLFVCDLFKSCGVTSYENKELNTWLSDVVGIIEEICQGLYGQDISEFMKNIFSLKNIGSGGQKQITGWISKVYCAVCAVPMLENFSLCIGVLPYTNRETGKKYIAAHGLFNTKRDAEGFTYPDYGQVIFEVLPNSYSAQRELLRNLLSRD